MEAFKRWAIPIVLVLAWLLAAGYTLASLSWASAAWRARTAPVQVEAQAKFAFSQADTGSKLDCRRHDGGRRDQQATESPCQQRARKIKSGTASAMRSPHPLRIARALAISRTRVAAASSTALS